MKRMSLYDLPCVLFENYIKDLNVVKTGEFNCLSKQQGEDRNYSCKFATIPAGNNDQIVTLVLYDGRNRDFDGLSFDSGYVKLLVSKSKIDINILNGGNVYVDDEKVESLLHRSGFIYSNLSTIGSRTFKGDKVSQFWISSGYELNTGEKKFSFYHSVGRNLHLLELAKKAQELFVNKEYEWVNSYYRHNGQLIPAEVSGVSVVEKND